MALYIIAIGWLYVALMMSVAEATHTAGTVLGAIITFVLYGVLPVALAMYILGTPARRRARRAREAAEAAPARPVAPQPEPGQADTPDEAQDTLRRDAPPTDSR